MPYYMTQLVVHVCAWQDCASKATHEVHLPNNDLMGRFCKTHAEQRVATMNAALATEIAAGVWDR